MKRVKTHAMKTLIISDSHGSAGLLRDLLKRMDREGRPDALIFCGDCLQDILPHKDFCPLFFPVRGNCDFGSYPAIPCERTERLQGIDILIAHGNSYHVKRARKRCAGARWRRRPGSAALATPIIRWGSGCTAC